jgi:hypothetical protein
LLLEWSGYATNQKNMNTRPFGRALTQDAPSPPPARRLRGAPLLDRRRASRRRVLAPGAVCFDSGIVHDCVIGDMSATGARVRVKPTARMLNNLFLVYLKEWAAYESRVIWRHTDGSVGLKFSRRHDLKPTYSPQFMGMRARCASFADRR